MLLTSHQKLAEGIRKLGDRSVEMIQTETQRDRKTRKQKVQDP